MANIEGKPQKMADIIRKLKNMAIKVRAPQLLLTLGITVLLLVWSSDFGFLQTRNAMSDESTQSKTSLVSSHRLWTVGEIKERMMLPCNYVHDGYYLEDSNEVLNQVHQSILYHLDDDIIPVVIECGGHDGITKSQTLKASRCLSVNTLLIEASPTTYHVLEKSRGPYDLTVNAALCDGESIQMVEDQVNSGATHVLRNGEDATETDAVITQTRCTSIDAELDKIRDSLPEQKQDKLQLIFLVLDVEGYEATAINGIQKYSPHKVLMAVRNLDKPDQEKVAAWAESHHLEGQNCNKADTCYNFDPSIQDEESSERVRSLLYGARLGKPKNTYKTQEVSTSYFFYGD
eukprot:scaffold6781_cov204-Amphora_coffeaeformis.AAC.12